MLKVAAGAIYDTRDVQGVSPARLRRFFLLGRGPREGSFRVVPEIRDLVKFRASGSAQPHLGTAQRLSHHLLPQCLDLLRRGRAPDSAQPSVAAPSPGGWLVMGNGEILPAVPASLRKHSPSLFQREG